MKLSFDLHLHSCLSPCGDDDMTPANLAGMCALAGLEVVALTDHNTCGNCRAFCRAAAAYGLLALPGMELTTREEVHVVCLFPDLTAAEAFAAVVYAALPNVSNKTEIFGRQLLMDEGDQVLGEEMRMLAGATDIGVYQVAELVKSYGGAAFPAHVDRPSFSLLGNLGLWDGDLGFPLAEVSHACPPGSLEQRPDMAGVTVITASDAHYLDQVHDACQTMEVAEGTARAVLDWLWAGGRAENS